MTAHALWLYMSGAILMLAVEIVQIDHFSKQRDFLDFALWPYTLYVEHVAGRVQ